MFNNDHKNLVYYFIIWILKAIYCIVKSRNELFSLIVLFSINYYVSTQINKQKNK